MKKTRKTKAIKKKRGDLNTGDKGGTQPYSITEEDFVIFDEEIFAYKNDMRDLELSEDATA